MDAKHIPELHYVNHDRRNIVIESKSHAGYPRDKGGCPPTSKAGPRSSVSREYAATKLKHGTTTMGVTGNPFQNVDEKIAAAWCAMRHGDPYFPDDVKKTQTAASDLMARTWRQDRDMNRDEKRLFSRYKKTTEAHDAESVNTWRECPHCASTHSDGDSND